MADWNRQDNGEKSPEQTHRITTEEWLGLKPSTRYDIEPEKELKEAEPEKREQDSPEEPSAEAERDPESTASEEAEYDQEMSASEEAEYDREMSASEEAEYDREMTASEETVRDLSAGSSEEQAPDQLDTDPEEAAAEPTADDAEESKSEDFLNNPETSAERETEEAQTIGGAEVPEAEVLTRSVADEGLSAGSDGKPEIVYQDSENGFVLIDREKEEAADKKTIVLDEDQLKNVSEAVIRYFVMLQAENSSEAGSGKKKKKKGKGKDAVRPLAITQKGFEEDTKKKARKEKKSGKKAKEQVLRAYHYDNRNDLAKEAFSGLSGELLEAAEKLLAQIEEDAGKASGVKEEKQKDDKIKKKDAEKAGKKQSDESAAKKEKESGKKKDKSEKADKPEKKKDKKKKQELYQAFKPSKKKKTKEDVQEAE